MLRFVPARLLVCIMLFAGLALSIPLWSATREIPLVPLAPGFTLPDPWSTIVMLVVILSAILCAVSPRRFYIEAFAISLLLMVLADNMRLQPWVWQEGMLLAVLGLGAALHTPDQGTEAAWMILGGTYFWSAILKINAMFIPTVLPFFTSAISSAPIDPAALTWIGYAMIAIEMGIGIACLIPAVRKPAAIVAALMHASILIVLFIHDWNLVVWPWNAGLMILLPLLAFRPSGVPLKHAHNMLSFAMIVLFWVLPVFHLFGYWDAYLSASLYSGNVDTATISMEGPGGSQFLDISSWAFETLGVPPYPEERVYRSIAKTFCDRQSGTGVVLTVNRRATLLRERSSINLSCSDL